MSTDNTELTFVRCPACGSLVPAVSTRCKMCGASLDFDNEIEGSSAASSSSGRVRQKTSSILNGNSPEELLADDSNQGEEVDLREGETQEFDPNMINQEDAFDPLSAYIEEVEVDGESNETTSPAESKDSDLADFFSDADADDDFSFLDEVEEVEAEEVAEEFSLSGSGEDEVSAVDQEIDSDSDFDVEADESEEEVEEDLFAGDEGDEDSDFIDNEDEEGEHEMAESPSDVDAIEEELFAVTVESGARKKGSDSKLSFSSNQDQPKSKAKKADKKKAKKEIKKEAKKETKKEAKKETKKENSIKPASKKVRARKKTGMDSITNKEVLGGRLVGWLVSYDDESGDSIELREGKCFVTSEGKRNQDIVINDDSISAPHALLRVSPSEGVLVQDLMSDHGCLLYTSDAADE